MGKEKINLYKLRGLNHNAYDVEEEWFYNGWQSATPDKGPFTQHDWNQTIMTVINRASSKVHGRTFRGGVNKLLVPTKLRPLIDSLEYSHEIEDGNYMFGGRYKIMFDDSLVDEILCFRDLTDSEIGVTGNNRISVSHSQYLIVPDYFREIKMEPFTDDEMVELGQISMKLIHTLKDINIANRWLASCKAKITIHNYE
jgi:hypothetical protein